MTSSGKSNHVNMGPPSSISRNQASNLSFSPSSRQIGSDRGSPTASYNNGAGGSSKGSNREEPKSRTLSCSECKRRKIKCDRNHPCGPCILRNDQARCKPVIRWEAGCSLSEFTMLQNRVNELESRLGSMQRVLEDVTGNHIGDSRMGVGFVTDDFKPDRSSPPNATNQGQLATSQRGANRDDDAVMMLEDFAMGNRANARRAAQKLNHENRPGDSPDESLYNLERGANQRSADSTIDVAYRFLRMIPEVDVTSEIVDFYFDRLEWQTRCLHRKSYMKDLHLLFGLTVEDAARTIRPSFLCLHLMVVCLAIHLASADQVKRWNIDPNTAMHLCDALFAGSQQLLWASDFIGCHQLEHLQAVVLISVYAYNVDEQADAAFALTGAAIKIAQNLSYHRLDDVRFMEKEKVKNRLVSGGQDVGQESKLERELSKRVWWYLIWLDWSHALSHGGSYAIHPNHNRTNLPANVDDEDLESLGELQAKPLEEYTSMSFSIWRLRFLIIYRETIDMINQPSGIGHKEVLEMDKKLMNLLHGLPSYFKLPEDSKKWMLGDSCHDMELLSIQITGHNRILRLHRPYLAKGLQDRNSISRKRCVEAAFSILALFRQARNHAPIILRVWINIYYVFSGALVLFLDLCYDSEADAQVTDEKRRAVRELLDICNEARHLSAAAKNTHTLLQGLLEAETGLRLRQEGDVLSGGKRKRSGVTDDETGQMTTAPFVSLVERVLIDAATKHSTGDSSTSSTAGRSPGDLFGSFSIDHPMKRDSTSFVRDRAGSMESRPTRGSPLAMTSSSTYPASNSGAGHGGYFNDAYYNQYGSNYRTSQSGNGPVYTPGGNMKAGTSGQPTSPWGPHSAIRNTTLNNGGGNAQGSNYQTSVVASGYASPTSANNNSSLGTIASPTTPQPGGDANTLNGRSGITQPFMSGNFTRAADTTNGLSSLLDEDIFSNLLMSQNMGTSEWENAFAFVAPNPAPSYPSTASSYPRQQNMIMPQQSQSGPTQ